MLRFRFWLKYACTRIAGQCSGAESILKFHLAVNMCEDEETTRN